MFSFSIVLVDVKNIGTMLGTIVTTDWNQPFKIATLVVFFLQLLAGRRTRRRWARWWISAPRSTRTGPLRYGTGIHSYLKRWQRVCQAELNRLKLLWTK